MSRAKKTLQKNTLTIQSSDPVLAYCNEVLSGKIVAGESVRLACKRHIDDLANGPARGLKWDLPAALRAISFFPEVLRLAEGEFAGKPFELGLWQKFIVGSLFGWKLSDGYRRFRTAYIEIAKGNGKSPMAGGIGLYMMNADREIGAHCFAAAATREQANILFQDAVKMVDASPALTSRITKSGKRHVFNLANLSTGSFFRPVSSEGKGLDGKRVHYAALDEIHEHPTAIVVDKMRAGTKGRRQALIFEITNSGHDRHSVCYHHHDYSRKVLGGILENDQWFAYTCHLDICSECRDSGKTTPSCDKCDQWTDEAVWPKANPNLGLSVTSKYLREQVREAQGMPSKENIVKRLNFCMWTEQAVRWMPMDKWDACAGTLYPESLRKHVCYGGLDLASTSDLAAFVLIFPEDDKYRVLPIFWVPEENARRRSEKDHVPYLDWIRQGYIKATEGATIDYDVIRRDINELADVYDIREIDYDPWNASQIVAQLEGDGFTMVKIRQGFESLNAATKELERMVRAGELVHGGNPVLRWNASNVSVRTDATGSIKPDKERSTERIDGISALVTAISRLIRMESSGSVYETRGILML